MCFLLCNKLFTTTTWSFACVSAGQLSHQVVVKRHHVKQNTVYLSSFCSTTMSTHSCWYSHILSPPPFPNLGIFFWGEGGWGSSSLPTSPGKPVVALTTSTLTDADCDCFPSAGIIPAQLQRLMQTSIRACGGRPAIQGLVCTVFPMFDMLIYPTRCMPSYPLCFVFLHSKGFVIACVLALQLLAPGATLCCFLYSEEGFSELLCNTNGAWAQYGQSTHCELLFMKSKHKVHQKQLLLLLFLITHFDFTTFISNQRPT